MLNHEEEFLGVDKNSGFALRVIILSVPAGLIFFILGLLDILPTPLAAFSYICILFFNTVFLMPISTELQRIKKYILNLSSNIPQSDLLVDFTEKETRDLGEAINSMHKFWSDKTDMLENRTLSDAAVLDTLPDPLIMLNQQKQIIGSNSAARTLFSSQLNGEDIKNFINDENFIRILQNITVTSREELNITLINLPEKPKFFLRISTIPLFSQQDEIIVISLYNLQKALKFEQMQQDFVTNASHELRTPLSIIAGFIETLQTSAKNDDLAREKFLRIMQEQTSYMSALIEDLLSISKIELSTDTLPSDTVNINAVIREIRSALELKFKEHNLSLSEKHARLPHITADKHQFFQVMQNIMENAAKYSSPNTTIKITTTKVDKIPSHRYYTVAEGNAVKISITNTGITISPDEISRITERFYRLQSHKNQNIRGTGLGLPIATQILKRHRGNLIISSAHNETTFDIYLPLKQETN